MRVSRIYLDAELASGAELELPSQQARHVAQVLRLAPGDDITLFNGDGRAWSARLIEATRHRTRVRIGSSGSVEPEPGLRIHLAIGISKGERMDLAVQKAVELGAASIAPLFTRRSQVRLDGARLDKRMEHWHGVMISACEQSGRCRLPELWPAQTLEAWLAEAAMGGKGLLLDPTASRAMAALSPPEGALTLLVGPEGGLSEGERDAARCNGFEGVRLGPRILRTETAPLAAIAVAQALWGDFRET